MENSVRYSLRKLITDQGVFLCNDRLLLEGLLRDCCGKYPREIRLLLLGFDETIPIILLNSKNNGCATYLVASLKTRLENSFALTSEASDWVVESWALALLGYHKNEITPLSPSMDFCHLLGSVKGKSFCIGYGKKCLAFAAVTIALVVSGYMFVNAGQKNFAIQVFSSKSRAVAQSHLCSLVEKGFEGFMVEASPWYKVRMESFNSREEAERIVSFLKSRNIIAKDSFVISSSAKDHLNFIGLRICGSF